jgi:phosphatidylglycerol lysyltransferase
MDTWGLERPEGGLARARDLVMRHGWNATAYQILNPGMRLWFSRAGDAVAGYAEWGRVRVVAGAPVCPAERLAEVAAELEADTRAQGAALCYFGAGSRLESLLAASPRYSRILLGAQPAWDPGEWKAILARRPSLRAQLNRARNKGVTVEEWTPERAASSPGLRRCLGEWLAQRRMPPMRFLVEPWILGRLWDRRIFVAQRDGGPVGFLVASPVPAREGWLIEQFVRGRAAPNGTAEAMVDAAFRAAAAEGLGYLTLGLSPLSHPARDGRASGPWWLAWLFRWLRAHGSRFYNFRGLEAFKSKFAPREWEPIYAISNTPGFGPRTLLAIAAAFGGISPFRFVAWALAKAARQEAGWLLGKTGKRIVPDGTRA